MPDLTEHELADGLQPIRGFVLAQALLYGMQPGPWTPWRPQLSFT